MRINLAASIENSFTFVDRQHPLYAHIRSFKSLALSHPDFLDPFLTSIGRWVDSERSLRNGQGPRWHVLRHFTRRSPFVISISIVEVKCGIPTT